VIKAVIRGVGSSREVGASFESGLVAFRLFVITDGEAAPVLDLADGTFDAVAELVQLLVPGDGPPAA
jgi:hypothetical protein